MNALNAVIPLLHYAYTSRFLIQITAFTAREWRCQTTAFTAFSARDAALELRADIGEKIRRLGNLIVFAEWEVS